MEIKLRLRELRKRAGLSQEELGLRVGSSQSRVGQLEKGGSLPGIVTLCRLADALGCKLSDLVQMEDD